MIEPIEARDKDSPTCCEFGIRKSEFGIAVLLCQIAMVGRRGLINPPPKRMLVSISTTPKRHRHSDFRSRISGFNWYGACRAALASRAFERLRDRNPPTVPRRRALSRQARQDRRTHNRRRAKRCEPSVRSIELSPEAEPPRRFVRDGGQPGPPPPRPDPWPAVSTIGSTARVAFSQPATWQRSTPWQ